MCRGPARGGPSVSLIASSAYFFLALPFLPFLLLFLPFFLLCFATLALWTLLLFTPPLATSLRLTVPGIDVTSDPKGGPLGVTGIAALASFSYSSLFFRASAAAFSSLDFFSAAAFSSLDFFSAAAFSSLDFFSAAAFSFA